LSVITENPATRVINFTDAIVAIAATLLILQPIDAAAPTQTLPLREILADNGDELVAFGVSFMVIGHFWFLHRRLFKTVQEVTPALFWMNLVWLLSIVFLPYPTSLLSGRTSDSATCALYIGTMTLTTVVAFILKILVPPLASEATAETDAPHHLLGSAAALVAMCIALVLSITVPPADLWGLLLLIPAMLVGRHRRPVRRVKSYQPSTG
jgi:uncharacterized membrane protein